LFSVQKKNRTTLLFIKFYNASENSEREEEVTILPQRERKDKQKR
jgi:hypothetical protein